MLNRLVALILAGVFVSAASLGAPSAAQADYPPFKNTCEKKSRTLPPDEEGNQVEGTTPYCACAWHGLETAKKHRADYDEAKPRVEARIAKQRKKILAAFNRQLRQIDKNGDKLLAGANKRAAYAEKMALRKGSKCTVSHSIKTKSASGILGSLLDLITGTIGKIFEQIFLPKPTVSYTCDKEPSGWAAIMKRLQTSLANSVKNYNRRAERIDIAADRTNKALDRLDKQWNDFVAKQGFLDREISNWEGAYSGC